MIQKNSKPVEFSQKLYENEVQFTAKRRNCGWSDATTTTQVARNRNTTRNRDEKDGETCRIFVNSHENEGLIRGEATKLWMERRYNKQHNKREKPERKTGVKIVGPS